MYYDVNISNILKRTLNKIHISKLAPKQNCQYHKSLLVLSYFTYVWVTNVIPAI